VVGAGAGGEQVEREKTHISSAVHKHTGKARGSQRFWAESAESHGNRTAVQYWPALRAFAGRPVGTL